MKKLFLMAVLFVTASCETESPNLFGFCTASEAKQVVAQSYYDSFGTTISDADDKEIEELFDCYYKNGDKVYSYNTLYGEKLVLVRYGQAVISKDRKKKPARSPMFR